MDKNIMVSVICTTYNHEKYIERALKSFVTQNTNFCFEVLVHDDASTDCTAKIIEKYAKKYPKIIKPILQVENQYSKKVNINTNFIIPRIKGKYVALCEGDDYWIDEYKLQKQFEVMENNEDCIMCSHKTEAFDLDNGKKWFLPLCNIETGIIPTNQVMDAVFGLMHLSSDMFRTDIYKEYRQSNLEYIKIMPTGDRAILLYVANRGKIYFINEPMSRYNKGVEGSYTKRIEQNKQNNIKKNKQILKAELIFKEECCKEIYKNDLDRKIAEDWFELKKSMNDYKIDKKGIDRDMLKLLSKKKRILCILGRFSPRTVSILWKVTHRNY